LRLLPPVSVEWNRLAPSRWSGTWLSPWDIAAALLVVGFVVLFALASRNLASPLASLPAEPSSLDPRLLPEYALRTSLRMLIAMGVSLLFTFTYATWAAKSPRMGPLLIALLDILQSVPILGFISITVVFFLSLTPGRMFGAELAAVFAIFTSQAWNKAFSYYKSLRTVPDELTEAGRVFGLSAWARFWRIETPFAMPSLIWNMMMSMSGGWFFVVAAEAISVGHTTIVLPGIGSYIALAIAERNMHAILWAIGAMLVVILIYDQLLFRPLVAWARRFRIDQQEGDDEPAPPWALLVLRRSKLMDRLALPFQTAMRWSYRQKPPSLAAPLPPRPSHRIAGDVLWYGVLLAAAAAALWQGWLFFGHEISWHELQEVLLLAFFTFLRVAVLIALASAVWTPVGIYVGLRPRLTAIVQPIAQFLAAFPANLLFPVAVSLIVAFQLNPDIWLSPLMILGTQWYILFNVIAGAAAIPRDFRDVGAGFQVRGLQWWRRIALPAVFPYYITGAITASGGSWNASIVAEIASWGDRTLEARGLGAYIADATTKGDYAHIALGIVVMAAVVTLVNRAFWRPLFRYAERKYRLA
jgi:NitT/TauT family transport system permease protein